VERVEQSLRRLALNDERYLRSALADPGVSSDLDAKTQALIRLGALLSVGAPTVSLRRTVELAAGRRDARRAAGDRARSDSPPTSWITPRTIRTSRAC
jgi:hypothetical protein